jgi:hypothetical protein
MVDGSGVESWQVAGSWAPEGGGAAIHLPPPQISENADNIEEKGEIYQILIIKTNSV